MTEEIAPLESDDEDDNISDALRAAQEAVAALAENYLVWLRADLESARTSLEKAHASAPDNAEAVREIFSVCHNIKGQGGSFGFELVTMIGEVLCDFTRDGDTASPARLKVIEAHIAALEFVAEREITGDGGEAGRELLDKLKRYIAEAV